MNIADFRKMIAKESASKANVSGANRLTSSIIQYLNGSGFSVWRNNVMGVFERKLLSKEIKKKGFPKNEKELNEYISKSYRKTHERKGVSDIIGYQKKTGRFVAIEVKCGNDKLSIEQRFFLQEVNRNGGFGMVAKTWEQFLNDFNL